jgi:gliding motility-associated-like protein
MKKIFFFLLFTLSLATTYAQYEASNWFFGDHAGLTFNSGSPVRLPGSQITTEEGCSSISNPCGGLVLYTDGSTVWNANHAVMTNGTGLMGDMSSTQSGIIVPQPDSFCDYYIFTVDDGFIGPSTNGMRYSKVDLTLSGGLGAVVSTEKNVQLVSHASEKVTAVISSDGSSIWVITFAPRTTSATAPYNTFGSNYNTFYAFRITSAGVQTTAVVSQVSINVGSGAGYMKVSPDGTKIAIANMNSDSAYLLDFDDATGVISNPLNLPLPSAGNSPYGVEFSLDSSKLYLSDRGSASSGALLQYDLANANAMTVINTRPNFRSALQLGIDGKIYQTHTTGYMSGTNMMSVIENPNEVGTACNYRYRMINLGSGMECHQGLPPFIQSYFLQIAGVNVAVNINANFEITSNEQISSVDWDFGDGSTTNTLPDNPPDNTHSQATHSYLNPGIYTVTATIHLLVGSCGGGSGSTCDVVVSTTIEIYPYPIATPVDDETFCDINENGFATLTLHDKDAEIQALQTYANGTYEVHYYPTHTDAENGTNELTDPYTTTTAYDEEIFFTVYNTLTTLTSIGSFHVIVNRLPDVAAVAPYEICDNDTDGFASFDLSTKEAEILGTQTNPPYVVNFYPTQADAEALTNEITPPYTNTTANNETVWYTITNSNTGCVNYGSLDLVVYPLIDVPMTDTFHICTGSTALIDAPVGFVAYLWSTGETTQSITVSTGGSYTVTVTNSNGCSNSKTVTVHESAPAVIENVKVVDFTDNNSITVFVTGLGDYEYSLDGTNYQESNVFEGLLPGTYMVYVNDINGCGEVTEEVELLGAPKFFTPNGDGYNDYWQVINVHKRPGTYVNIYNRYGKLVKVLLATEKGWDGTFNGNASPSTDYWYEVFVKEDDKYRRIKGHFTLKR